MVNNNSWDDLLDFKKWEKLLSDPESLSKAVRIGLSGNANEWKKLNSNEKTIRYLIDVAGIGLSLGADKVLPKPLQKYVPVVKAAGSAYFLNDLTNGLAEDLPPLVEQAKEGIKDAIDDYKMQWKVPAKIKSEPYFDNNKLNLGDYELIFFNLDKKTLEERTKLFELLDYVDRNSKDLPTVGVELEYFSEIGKEAKKQLNYGRHALPNEVPETYSTKDKSEVRLLPTNPYAFRWLLEEVGNYLPKRATSVQVSVGKVDSERMPYAGLALYFMSPCSIFPTVKETHGDEISFPGGYVGQTVLRDGSLIYRGQSNLSVIQSADMQEVADAVFFAAKIYSLPKKEFEDFKKELTNYLGLNPDPLVGAVNELKMYDTSGNMMYRLNSNHLLNAIDQAKNHLEMKVLEQVALKAIESKESLDDEVISKMNEINETVKNIISKHTITGDLELMYRCSLEEALKNYEINK
ncbi:hypothetical protein HY837_03170 [archaeon]|nr:hypothetical protein [archaeon]